MLTTSTGAVQLWHSDKAQWTREEGLSDIRAAALLELPEVKFAAGGVEGEGFAHRLVRHAADAQNLPAFVAAFARRFVTGDYASVSAAAGGLMSSRTPPRTGM